MYMYLKAKKYIVDWNSSCYRESTCVFCSPCSNPRQVWHSHVVKDDLSIKIVTTFTAIVRNVMRYCNALLCTAPNPPPIGWR